MLRKLALLTAAVVVLAGAVNRPAVLYLAGDSTMAQKLAERRPETGWGEALQQYFDIDQVRVDNRARNGRSTRSFIAEGRWQAILDDLRAGDYVIIQFGHNDESKEKGDRYTVPEQFKANLTRFVQDVRGKHATPILPMCLQSPDQTIVSEFFSCGVERFGHTIGIQRDRIARFKMTFFHAAIPFSEQSEHGAR